MKTLIIAEKPDMGRNIAKAIDPKAVNHKTYLEGERYIISWAIGHLLTLAEPEHYDAKYKKWSFTHLPILPPSFHLVPIHRTKSQLTVLKELAKRCGDIVNACDAGREGQLIFEYIRRHLQLGQPVRRLWISDLTPETIRKGFAELKDDIEYEPLTRAARARSEADWLIGMNGSRAFTVRHGTLLSVGRVQTPVLAIIYDRQKEIEAFTEAKYYEVKASFEQALHDSSTNYQGTWMGDRITQPEQAEALAAKVRNQPGRIVSYEAKPGKEYPYKLYDLTLLQREANARFGFSAKKTLDIAQALYEKHKLITYPRTNSNYVTEQNIPDMHRTLDMLAGTEYGTLVQGADKKLVHPGNKAVCNPMKVEDHHAILPTKKRPVGIKGDEEKLYDLVVRRMLSHYYPAAEHISHAVITEVAGESFKTNIKQRVSLGWKVLYDNTEQSAKKKGKPDNAEEQEVEISGGFSLDGNMPIHCNESDVLEKSTKPPKHYTEGTLLKAMETAGKNVSDEELRDAMKDSGLGTPATRAATIERLKNVGYIEMNGKQITITPKGRIAIELIRGAGVQLLTSAEMTGQWERRLTEIARGQASDDTFLTKVKAFASSIIDKVRSQQQSNLKAMEEEWKAAAAKPKTKSRSSTSKKDSALEETDETQPSAAGSRKTAVAKAAPVTTPSGHTIIAPCPREGCGGTIIKGTRGYGCSHYKQGCRFVIWKSTLGKSISEAAARSIIEKGSSGKMSFQDDNGDYQGRIKLTDRNTGELVIERI